jgi:multidrug efflux pump subunit AcrA (membrane-fusion protein)
MFSKKYALPVLLALALAGCASESPSDEERADDEMLYLEALEENGGNSTAQNQGNQLQTTVVKRENLTTWYTLDASRLYPFGMEIAYENTDAVITFEECLVQEGEMVKEGQELVRLSQSVDEIDALETAMAYERMSAALDVRCEDYERRLALLEEGSYEYELLKYEYDQEQEETKKTLEELSGQLEAYEQIRQNPEITLTAPYDGYADSIMDKMQGEAVTSGEGLMTLQNISVWYYTLEDSSAAIPIGRTVTLKEELDGQELEIQGVVVCGDMALDEGARKGYALVKPETVLLDGANVTEQLDPSILPLSMSVELCQMELTDVLTVSQDYVYQDDSQSYVYLLENDEQVKTYVVCLVNRVNGKSWILSGVEEGDVLAMH